MQLVLLVRLGAGAGTLPPAWGGWKSLFVLMAGANRLSGTLPPEWADPPGLLALDLSMNRLTGTLPAVWGKSASLMAVLLNDNRLSGTLPPTWRMESINVAWNNLTGPLPPSWVAPGSLRLAGNNLSGPVPATWSRAKLSSLSLNDNPGLSGCLPSAWRQPNFVLTTTQRGNIGLPFDVGSREARARQARQYGNMDGALPDTLTGGAPAANGPVPAASMAVALQGTRLTGYC